jgi:hypothetical protein
MTTNITDQLRHLEDLAAMCEPGYGMGSEPFRQAREEIERLRELVVALQEARPKVCSEQNMAVKRLQTIQAENTRLRAALAQSDLPCVYCSLPADEWNKCQHGWPGCGRADDAMGCPELGAGMEVARLQEQVAMLRDVLRQAEYAIGNHIKSHSWRDNDGLVVWAEHWLPDAREALAHHTSSADSGSLAD